MICRRRSVAPQTAYVFTFLPDKAPSDGCCPPEKLLARRCGTAECGIRTELDDEIDAGREPFADVETARSLLVVPIESVPVWSMARSGRWALLAAGFPTPHVLLAVDHSIWSTINRTLAQIGAARPTERHAKSLHKSRLSASNSVGGLGW
jgi:hypothetical protein